MAFIQWSDALSVNLPEFDEEHKKLVKIINELHDALGLGKGSEVMSKTLRELVSYAQTHFKHEEEFMMLHNFPVADFEAHRKEHVYFIMKLDEFCRGYGDGAVTFPIHVLNFLESWLLGHVQKTDMKYSNLGK
jgi:hemerythrin